MKFQSNSEIAGSPRNSFRASLGWDPAEHERKLGFGGSSESLGGRALIGLGALIGLPNSVKLRMPMTYVRESDDEC